MRCPISNPHVCVCVCTCGESSHGDTKARTDGGNGGGVGAVRCDLSVRVEKRVARHAQVIKPQLTVVNAVQALLGTHVLQRRTHTHTTCQTHCY